MEAFRKIYPSEFYKKFLVHKVRPDGRPLSKVRKTNISVGSLLNTNGSSFVKLGNTSVICGIEGQVGLPPQEGDPQIAINVEQLPLCSPNFRKKKQPPEMSQVLTQLLNQLGGNLISTKELNVVTKKEEKLSWYLYIDVYFVNYDGNAFDGCLISIIAALTNVRLPSLSMNEEGAIIATQARPHKLTLLHYPISLTFGILEEHLIVDPTAEEERLLNGSFTIVYNEKGELCLLVKPGGAIITDNQIKGCIEATKLRVTQVIHLINKAFIYNTIHRETQFEENTPY